MARKSKKFRRRIAFTVPITLCIICFSLFSCATELIKINNLVKEEKELKVELQKLVQESKALDIEITKLNDPDYIARYAREKYLYSKDDEIVVIIENAEKVDEVSNQINKNYILVGITFCVTILLAIFVFVFRKNKKTK